MADSTQEQLFVIGDRTGQVEARDFSIDGHEFPQTSLVERDIHLQNALSLLGKISLLEGFIKAATNPGDETRLRQRYSRALETVANNAGSKIRSLDDQVTDAFNAAYGLKGLVDQYPEARGWAKRDKAAFLGRYAHAWKAKERTMYLHELEANVAAIQLQQEVVATSRAHRSTGERPHAPHEARPMPSTQERLKAISGDARAGFLPATNNEKNKVLAILDYLDNPKYPLEFTNQLLEIFNHQQRERKRQDGLIPGGGRSLESIVYEFADFLEQSTEQLGWLQDFEIKLQECVNPRVTIYEEPDIIEASHPGFPVIARFIDLSRLREIGNVEGVEDPLRSRVDRWAHGDTPGRHKIVEDLYTSKDVVKARPNIAAERIAAVVKDLTVREVREIVRAAVVDQQKRRAFMELCLRQTCRVAYGPKTRPRWVAVAEAELERLGYEI